jgi:hypothetical protein
MMAATRTTTELGGDALGAQADRGGEPLAARRPPARWARWARRGVAVAAGIWLGAAAATLLVAWWHAERAADRLAVAVDGASAGSLLSGRSLADLRAARADFAAANTRSGSALLAPLRAVPLVGRQIEAAGALSGAAVEVLDTGIEAVEASREQVEHAREGGSARIVALETVADIAREAGLEVDRVDLGPSGLLAPPLASSRADFAEHLAELDEAIERLRVASAGLASMLEGPRSYLLLAGNNNEMRIGSGTFLTAGVLRIDGGELELSRTVPTANLLIPPERAPALPPDQDALWGWLLPTSEWRNLGASPRFDVTGRLAAEMAAIAFGGQVDGVLAVDPFALRAIVAATGEVEYRGGVLTAESVLPELLWAQYEGIERYDDPQIERREDLGDLARAALRVIDAGDWDAATLLDELGGAAAGRHVLAWSRHADEQRAFEAAGIAGTLEPESLFVGVHNRGGNKLDTFLTVAADLSVDEAGGSGVRVAVRLELENVAPPDLPRYIEGPYPGAVGGAAGLYQGLVVLQVPGAATEIGARGGEEVLGHAPDGMHRAVVVQVRIPRGGSDTIEVTFRLPESVEHLRIEPSARAQPIGWRFDGERFTDVSPRVIDW